MDASEASPAPPPAVRVRGARENNLRAASVDIPHDRLTVVTGVSGSGKSSLAYDVVFREAQRRFLDSFSEAARSWLGKLRRPEVDHIDGLRPAAAVSQRTSAAGARSTVGTMSEIYDWLRLLFARLGQAPPGTALDRGLFSFNSPRGACPVCRGLGVEDRIDPDLLVADPAKSLRRGALALTTPNGYIIYSQVTMDVLDRVCRAHGFNVDTPWAELGSAERAVVLGGSDRIAVPIGKHPLESRLRWTGITPRPREEGFYKGIIPVMEGILKAKRNPGVLRYARTLVCRACGGARLRPEALAVRFRGRSIGELAAETIAGLDAFLAGLDFAPPERAAGEAIREAVLKRTRLLSRLGLGYLTIDRASSSLSGGEFQRLRLAAQAGSGLRGMLYVFDEPTAGCHPADTARLFDVLRELRDLGNTLLVVEHDESVIRAADQVIDLGPGAGESGGRVLYCGPPAGLMTLPEGASPTRDALAAPPAALSRPRREGRGSIIVEGARLFNLRSLRAEFRRGAFNAVTGVSGAGKTTLVRRILAARLRDKRYGPGPDAEAVRVDGPCGPVVEIDASPIGRTSRSNPATYTGISDRLRDLFAALPEAAARGYSKSRFSFNVPGGRCETCGGAGCLTVGMHFLEDVDVPCPACEDRRFNPETLEVLFRGRSIHDILDMGIAEAAAFFEDSPALARELQVLVRLGLGYLRLGQSSTTLSGGEAQRIKLAAALQRPEAGKGIYIFEEPTTGLHARDVAVLLEAFQDLVDRGGTIIAVEHHPGFIAAADWVVDLGPGAGAEGGRVTASGTPEEIVRSGSLTGRALARAVQTRPAAPAAAARTAPEKSGEPIRLRGVSTHNLRGIDVDIPLESLTVLCGPSGSGKSSLAFDTLFAESRTRFLESYSTWVRSRLDQGGRADLESAWGLTPAVAVSARPSARSPRSTVGTMTEIYDYLRLLYSRAGAPPPDAPPGRLPARDFSFNHEDGACRRCHGLGTTTGGDPDRIITAPERPLTAGALDGTKTGRFYGDPHGQHVAALRAAGAALGIDFDRPYRDLDDKARWVALHGTGPAVYDIVWSYRRGRRSGDFRFRGAWKGFLNLVAEEYERKHADRRGEALRALMKDDPCPDCRGGRLRPEALAVRLFGRSIAEISALDAGAALRLFEDDAVFQALPSAERAAASAVRGEIIRRLRLLRDVGLGYLSIDRRTSSLSGGEAQRLRLAEFLGARLSGMTYILDEPTHGLHARDTDRLIGLIRGLVRERNTVVVVEHDPDVIRAADWVLDMGPGAGRAGGTIVARGRPADIWNDPASVTGTALKRSVAAEAPLHAEPKPGIRIRGARANNLRDIDAEFPAGAMTVVTGVSGSGKTSLALDVLAASARLGRAAACASIAGLESYDKVLVIDQDIPAAAGSSIVATAMDLFDGLRAVYASAPEAKALGLTKSHFSFLTPSGRCPECRGAGRVGAGLDFAPDVESPCESCGGARYRPEPLRVLRNGTTIAGALETAISDSGEWLGGDKKAARILAVLEELGLGYLRLGQDLGMLSAGERQRLKLASELAAAGDGTVLFILDEPTAGLHASDVENLWGVFDRLLRRGHTIVAVEHHLEIIARAHRIIDLGPEGGADGGRIVAAGAPAEIERHPGSATGAALRRRRNQNAPS